MEQVRKHPYQALLVAAGVGYILGGGLVSRLTLSVVRTGLRMGALPFDESDDSRAPLTRAPPGSSRR